ncbi:hypothetical protein CEF21_20710 [Bacillus sp. FJAT-42376]|uniref:DUF5381 family protein n=1 Tax=Bacillus sp. FJAT-42376 TaxID=2014076 RepID=UPI000F4F06E3|nr:DUF5381 family protein [Bacillus sp. FJAT-42376]AZB44516.1 hypothetical protein CEF21_20710 [Bacillus sp. FJAT-42376]
MQETNKKDIIKIKCNKTNLIFGLAATAGAFIVFGTIFLFAIKFTSLYDILGIFGGALGMAFTFYMFINAAPGLFSKNRVIFTIIPGPDGRIESSKQSVLIKHIKDYKIARSGVTPRALFFEDLIIFTYDNKKVKLPTYNLLNYQDLNNDLKKYLLPYMSQEAQTHFQSKVKNFPRQTENIK